MASRFEKFSERARKVLTQAQEEAQRFNHNYIGTEHLLLGLVREGDGVAAKVLSNLGVELNKVRSAVEFIIGRGDRATTGEIGLTPRAKKVIELAGACRRRQVDAQLVQRRCARLPRPGGRPLLRLRLRKNAGRLGAYALQVHAQALEYAGCDALAFADESQQ